MGSAEFAGRMEILGRDSVTTRNRRSLVSRGRNDRRRHSAGGYLRIRSKKYNEGSHRRYLQGRSTVLDLPHSRLGPAVFLPGTGPLASFGVLQMKGKNR